MTLAPEIDPRQSVELLKHLHLLTRDGKLNQDSRRKLKQVYHLVQLVQPLLQEAMDHNPNLHVVDHGAGKSYLGFILYDLFFKQLAHGHIHGIETRPELVQTTRALAAQLGFERMQFLNLSVEASMQASDLPAKVDMVTALHACNNATDDAIAFALQKQADFIVLVPCCQAEVASELRRVKNQALASTALAELWRHPLHSREFGSHLTNVLRCLQLQAHGYQVTVTELVGWEHSMKNELILARQKHQPRGDARARLAYLLETLHLQALQPRFLA